ncbi:MAG: immunoglobulin domain-containing protein [Planctomycetes bacterium]|nr:immunoglobulin domain-containing protein [Planctomycetota bacterium]
MTSRVITGLCVLVVLPAALRAEAGRYGVKASGMVEAHTGTIEPLRFTNPPPGREPQKLSREELDAIAACSAEPRPRIPLRKDPNVTPQDYQRSGAPTPIPVDLSGRSATSSGGGDFRIFRTSSVASVLPGDTSFPEEPTTAMNRDLVFYTGNTYAALSGDGGITWTYVNPFDNFPADGINDVPANSGGFCCDQVVYYEPNTDCMFWLLQYATPRDAMNNRIIGNVQRLAVSCGRDNLLANQWPLVLDFSPPMFGFAPQSFWLDFPNLAVSNRFLYYTTNVFTLGGAAAASVITRIPLDYLRTGNGGYYQYYSFTEHFGLRCVHGATEFMYWGSHDDNDTLRIYHWWDQSNDIGYDDVDHPAFEDDDFRAFAPDGTNFAAFSDSRILGAYLANGELGFMYNCSQKNSPFAYPYVDVGKYRETDREYLTTQPIFNPSTAMLYPSVHPNSYGAKGGTISFGGGLLYPGFYAFIADAFNNHSFSPLEVVGIASGSSGPPINRWGDYVATRQHWYAPETWIGTGFTMNGSGGTNPTPYFVWFGREQDEPAADFDINNVQVNPLMPPYAVGGTLPVQVSVANAGARTADVPNLDLRLSLDTSIDGTDTALQSLPVSLDPGQVLTVNANAFIPDVPAGDYYVGAFTPFYVDGYVGNNSLVFPTPFRICPGFVEQPPTLFVDACGDAVFHVTMTGSRNRQFQWQKDGRNLFDDGDRIFGAQSDTLTIRSVYPGDEGDYSVVVTEGPCAVASAVAHLFEIPPRATSIAGAGNFEVCTDTVLDATIAGIPAFSFQWDKNGLPLADDGRITGSNAEDLSLPSLELADTGRYSLFVGNYCDSSVSPPVHVNVVPKPWTSVASTGPTFRTGPSMAYDSRRGVTVLFGGQYPDYSSVTRDTWEWNGNTWALRATSGPPGLAGAGMAFDEDRGKCVLFGGFAGGSGSDPAAYRSETWEWDGTSWTQIMTGGPTARSGPGLVYDTVARKIVLHGGFSVAGPLYPHDTWEYDGISGTWSQVSSDLPDAAPGNYNFVGQMGFDRARKKRVVFNGWGVPGIGPVELRTFEWENGQWVRVFPANDPRYQPGQPGSTCCGNPGVLTGGGGIAFHEARRMIILNNGRAPFNDGLRWTWGYDGATWHLLSINDGPPTSEGGNLAYDRARNALVQFGGGGPTGFVPPNTWELADADRIHIVRQPAHRAVVSGQPAEFSVTVKGAPAYSFQWRRDGMNLTDGGTTSGANTGILRIGAATAADAGEYDVVVTNDCGTVTSAAANLNVVATRLGDADGDNDVDLADAELLGGCMTGPGMPATAGCEAFDFDGDGDVDAADVAAFQRVFGE